MGGRRAGSGVTAPGSVLSVYGGRVGKRGAQISTRSRVAYAVAGAAILLVAWLVLLPIDPQGLSGPVSLATLAALGMLIIAATGKG